MSDFVEVQTVYGEVRYLEQEASIFGADTKVMGQVEIDAATINECGLGLPFNTVDQKFVRGIENQRSGPGQCVRSDACDAQRDMCNE